MGRGEPSRGGRSTVVSKRTAGTKAQRSECMWHGEEASVPHRSYEYGKHGARGRRASGDAQCGKCPWTLFSRTIENL